MGCREKVSHEAPLPPPTCTPFWSFSLRNWPPSAVVFHVAGELYAGHYVPKFALAILSHPDRSFTLSLVLIGNGITDPLVQIGPFRLMLCGEGGRAPCKRHDVRCHGARLRAVRAVGR